MLMDFLCPDDQQPQSWSGIRRTGCICAVKFRPSRAPVLPLKLWLGRGHLIQHVTSSKPRPLGLCQFGSKLCSDSLEPSNTRENNTNPDSVLISRFKVFQVHLLAFTHIRIVFTGLQAPFNPNSVKPPEQPEPHCSGSWRLHRQIPQLYTFKLSSVLIT